MIWCSNYTNLINVYDLQVQQHITSFEGATIKERQSRVSEEMLLFPIPDSEYLISTNYARNCSNFEIFDSKKNFLRVFSLGKRPGYINDVAFIKQQKHVAFLSVQSTVGFHLFDYDTQEFVKKTKWPFDTQDSITSFDIDSTGKNSAFLNRYGTCAVVDLVSDDHLFDLNLEDRFGNFNRCRWNPFNSQILAVASSNNKFFLIDTEKQNTLHKLKSPAGASYILWLDWRSDGNLVAWCDSLGGVRIFDIRENCIVKTFSGLHSEWIRTVRWSPCGNMIATASDDMTIKLADLATAHVLYKTNTADGQWARSVCFI